MKVAVIIQGEGKGHFSQAMEAIQVLHAQGDEITGCYLGRSLFRKMPGYFREASPLPLKIYLAPNFLHTPDRKGIHIFFSLLLNMLLIPVYLFEAVRLGIMLRRDGSEQLLNFYDPVGALAGKWMKRNSRKIMISHHFYLSHPDFIHPHGLEHAFFWLQLMNAIMMRQADEVFALSFREGASHGRIRVVPPLVSGKLRNVRENETSGVRKPANSDTSAESLGAASRGADGGSRAESRGSESRGANSDTRADSRGANSDTRADSRGAESHGADSDPRAGIRGADLCYFLNPGFAEEMVNYYRSRPHLVADIFTEAPLQLQPPVNVRVHRPDRDTFLSAIQHAGRIICTAGFDTVAEAFWLGIPVFVIPSENHYEQYCNALDAARTGMAYQLETLAELDEAVFEPQGNVTFVKWLEMGHDMIFRADG